MHGVGGGGIRFQVQGSSSADACLYIKAPRTIMNPHFHAIEVKLLAFEGCKYFCKTLYASSGMMQFGWAGTAMWVWKRCLWKRSSNPEALYDLQRMTTFHCTSYITVFASACMHVCACMWGWGWSCVRVCFCNWVELQTKHCSSDTESKGDSHHRFTTFCDGFGDLLDNQ